MSERFLKILLVLVAVCTLIVLGAVLILIWSMPPLPNRVITDEICLPDRAGILICKKTEKRLYEYTKRRIEDNIETLQKDYDEYVKNVNDENTENHIQLKAFVDEQYIDRKPAARVVMSRPNEVKKEPIVPGSNNTMVLIRSWETGKDLRDYGGFLRFAMRCSGGRLMVPVTGTYTVYSHVGLSPKPGQIEQSLRHSLYKYNIKENRETELVSNLRPKQNSTQKNMNEQSSFLNSIVKLTSGEELLVKISNNADLPVHHQNYLAAYLI